jgi:hypothetical protein
MLGGGAESLFSDDRLQINFEVKRQAVTLMLKPVAITQPPLINLTPYTYGTPSDNFLNGCT